jgi:hypothetical protein
MPLSSLVISDKSFELMVTLLSIWTSGKAISGRWGLFDLLKRGRVGNYRDAAT